jgi:hypothetical protein
MDARQLLTEMAAAPPRSLRMVALKLTYAGPQRKPVPSILFSTYYRLPSMEQFMPLRDPGLNYANDDIALLHFVVAEPELSGMLTAAAQSIDMMDPAAGLPPMVALAVHRERETSGETSIGGYAVLSKIPALTMVEGMLAALSKHNEIGREVMSLFRRAAFGQDADDVLDGQP